MYFYLILIKIIFIFPIIPLWNFQNSVTELLTSSNSYSKIITIFEQTIYNKKFKIIKTINKVDGVINEINKLTIDSEYDKETKWEGVESSYEIYGTIYICPTGRNYLNKYTGTGFVEIKPKELSGDWELKCFYQYNENFFFQAFLNNDNSLYYSKDNDLNSWKNDNTNIYNCKYIYDFQLQLEGNDNHEYKMYEILLKDNSLILHDTIMTIKGHENGVWSNPQKTKNLFENFGTSYGYFNNNDSNFYFFTYNDTYLKTGYYDKSTTIDLEYIDVEKYEDSPLDFLYDFTIQKINNIRNTKYIFYEIYNNKTEKKYYGFFDIKLNKVIFNTDEVINSYGLLSSEPISFFVRTSDSVYKICPIADENNNCIESCDSPNNLFINSIGQNFCGSECSSEFIMMKNEICIDECDENIFYKLDNKCGLCKDLNEENKYKLINTTGCFSDIPEGAEIYDHKHYLLKCQEDYYLIEGSCISTVDTTQETIVEINPPQNQCEENEIILQYYNPKNNSEIKYKCIKKTSERVYYDSQDQYYKLCYETCLTCNQTGNKNRNNCIKCEKDYRERKIDSNSNEFNCIPKCLYFYINPYNQYKCIDQLPCPQEAKYFIKERYQCTDNCKKDSQYKFAYNGNCVEECPKGTSIDDNDAYNICKDPDNQFKLSTNNVELNHTSFIEVIDTYVQRYSEEFSYTNSHVTQFINEEYTSLIYKDPESINQLSLDFPNFDFGECYEEVKRINNISQELIVVVINKNDNEGNNPDTSYSFYHPITGKKLETEEICKDYKVKIIENIFSLIKNLSNYDSLISLVNQGINIFNTSDRFYTDICYDYNFETNKDIALQDRLKLFFPNISLCDDGCNQTEVNLEKMTAHCECEFNDIKTKENNHGKSNIKDNILIGNLMGNVFDFIDSSNIGVGKCLKKSVKYILKCIGLYVSIFMIILHTIMTILYSILGLKKIKIYINDITSNYLKYISPKNINNNASPFRKSKENQEKKNKIKKNKKRKLKIINISNKLQNLNLIISNKNDEKETNQSFLKLEKTHMKQLLASSKNFTNINNSFNKNIQTFFKEYLSESLDKMDFDDAIRNDHRKFSEFFLDCLREKQIILNTFLAYHPFKPRSIKIILFSLTMFLYFIVNALFINDSYVSEVYNLKEDKFFDFITRAIDRFFYATVVGIVIEFIVDFFFVEEKKMKGIFIREKDNSFNIKEEIVLLVSLIKKRYIYFIIFVYIILIIGSYYLLCFNSIYPHMQIEWIKSSIVIIFLRQILSVLQCLSETSLRIISFRYESEKFFKISKLVN